MSPETPTNTTFSRRIRTILIFVGFLVYLASVWQIGQIGLNHANFELVRDENGSQVLDEQGKPMQRAAAPPRIPELIGLIATTIGAALAVNFGVVIGIKAHEFREPITVTEQQVIEEQAENVVNQLQKTPLVRSFLPTSQPEVGKAVIAALLVSVLPIRRLLGSIRHNLSTLQPQEWAAVVYLASLLLGAGFFVLDGGLSADSGTIATEIKTMALTLLGILGGAVASLNANQ